MFYGTDPWPTWPIHICWPTDPLSTALIRPQFAIECLQRSSQQRQVTLGQSLKVWGEMVDPCNAVIQILIRSCKDMGLSYAKEIYLIFCRLSTIHEHDRQIDHGTVTSIAIGEISCQQCRLKWLAYKLIELKNQHHFHKVTCNWQFRLSETDSEFFCEILDAKLYTQTKYHIS